MTDEYRVGQCYQRLTMIDLAFDDADHHLMRLAARGSRLAARGSRLAARLAATSDASRAIA